MCPLNSEQKNTTKMKSQLLQEPPKRSHHIVITTANEDEVSLLEIVIALRCQWKLICAVTFGVTLLVFGIVLQMPRVYRAEVVLLPPKASDVTLFNIPDVYANATSEKKLYMYMTTPEDLYAAMLRNLRSNSLRHQFFVKYGLYDQLKDKSDDDSEYKVFSEKFNDQLMVDDGGARKENLEYVIIFLDGPRQDLVARWLNDFVNFVDAVTVEEVISAINARVRIKTSSLRDQIESLRVTAKRIRENEIERLSDSLEIARKTPRLENTTSLEKLTPVENTEEVQALEAEIEVLKNRKSDDPYIAGLPDIQEQLFFWDNLHVQEKGVHAVRIDKTAKNDDNMIKPKWKLLLAIGFAAGLFAALFVALVRFFIIRQKNIEEDKLGTC